MRTQNNQEEEINLPISFWEYQEIIAKINNLTFESGLGFPENEMLGNKILNLIEEILKNHRIKYINKYNENK